MNLNKSVILLTGGTGSFGTAFIRHMLSSRSFKGIIRIFSRDEFKQYQLQQEYPNESRLRYFIGDVRELPRLKRAMTGVDIVIHAAALKQVPILEYNPFEAVKTNIVGTQNVIDAAIDLKVGKGLLISSDKAVSPVNLYGASKMVAEKLFVQSNSYTGGKNTIFAVVRYGNVMGSRGSVVPIFKKQASTNMLEITDSEMTRFWITLEEGINFVVNSLAAMKGGEIFVPKLPSIKITDLAKAISPKAKIKIIGIRPGEKVHEVLVNENEFRHTREFSKYFVIEPEFIFWEKTRKPYKNKFIKNNFSYRSDNNSRWLTIEQITRLLKRD